ncbi:MAG: hypothetical protein II220_08515, partial [Spirochaetales bacterium]|nr:hypothetical protein [Spirochaetales bacterium]
ITATVPEKSLVSGKRSTGGRNNTGKMTMRYRGGGHKRYGDEVKNLNNHELIFSTPIKTKDGFYDYYSGKVLVDYFIPFYDKTSNKYMLAGFTSNNTFIGIATR